MNIKIAVFALAVLSAPGLTMACYQENRLPAVQAVDHIQSVQNIVLARMIEARWEAGANHYRFRVLENVKGDSAEFLDLAIDNSYRGLSIPVGEHTDVMFWLYGEGGSRISEDCGVRPSFGLGRDYLLLLNGDPTSITYEEVVFRTTDLWYRFVNRIASENQNPEALLTENEFLEQFGSIHLYRCPSDPDERGISPVLLKSLKGEPPPDSQWPGQGGIRCDGEPHVFAVFSLMPRREGSTFYFRMIDGAADLSHYTHGVELIPGNAIDLGAYFDLDLSE